VLAFSDRTLAKKRHGENLHGDYLNLTTTKKYKPGYDLKLVHEWKAFLRHLGQFFYFL
jgi:hypothetical protein